MNYRLLMGLAGWVLAIPTMAQVSVTVELDQDQYLPGESIIATARITNLSGQPLHLGQSKDWLQFTIESRDNDRVVGSELDPPVVEPFILESSKVAVRILDLAPLYNLTSIGRYRLSVLVKIDQWDQVVAGEPKNFDVVGGVRLWEQKFGVPSGGDTAPEVRKYILQKSFYVKELRLYARVTDGSELRTFRVFPLSKVISFSKPEAFVDGESNLHVLNQTGPRTFFYGVINPDGALMVRQTHDYTPASRPILKITPEGKVQVIGGRRRLALDDLPPTPRPEVTATTQTTTNAQPVVTPAPAKDAKSTKKKRR